MAGVLLNGEKKEKPKRKVITGATVLIRYTDWKGLTEDRFITPIPNSNFWHEGDAHYPDKQWMIKAWDHKLCRIVSLAMKDIKKWEVYG